MKVRWRLVQILVVGTLVCAAPLAGQTPSAPLLRRTVFETPVATHHGALVVGPDGNLWYMRSALIGDFSWNSAVGRLTPSGDTVELGIGASDNLLPTLTIAAGKVWYSRVHAERTPGGVIGITSLGSVIPGPTPTLDGEIPATIEAMTTATDDSIWILSVSQFGRYVPGGVPDMHPCGSPPGGPPPQEITCRGTIAAGPSNDVWFTYKESPRIGHANSAGSLTRYDLPGWSVPYGIGRGADGAIWFTDLTRPFVGRLSQAGDLDEVPIPSGAVGTDITRAADGSLWFSTRLGFARLALTGFGVPTVQEFPSREFFGPITGSPDGTLWAAEGDHIVHLETLPCPDDSLCLQGRFRVRLSWRSAEGGVATATPVTRNTTHGDFWFFSPGNVEVAIKIVDGRANNGHFWVFGASLTNVEYDLEVTDIESSVVWTHHNAAGELASFADTSAF